MTSQTKASQIVKGSQNQPQYHHYLRLSRRYVFIIFTLSLIIIACTNTSKLKQFTLTQAVLFADSQQQKKALDFLAYLIQSQVIGKYLKAAGGCNLPVLEPLWQDPFWKDSTDPDVSTAVKTVTEGSTRLFYYVQNPAYSVVLEENI